jgi:uncharacterized membrane protein HdeD (DUF308 family)
MTSSSVFSTSSDKTSTSWWGALLLGAVFLLAGMFVLGDVVLATVISAILIGFMLIVAGAGEILHAFSAPHWRGLFLRLLIGALYAVCGVMLISDPLGSSILLTLLFAISLIASGVVRLFQAYQYWRWSGDLLLLSGIVGIVAGLVILFKWPVSGLWVLGLVVGIDLLLHGIWWISLGLRLRQERKAVPA